jgi:hypothetical protein
MKIYIIYKIIYFYNNNHFYFFEFSVTQYSEFTGMNPEFFSVVHNSNKSCNFASNIQTVLFLSKIFSAEMLLLALVLLL